MLHLQRIDGPIYVVVLLSMPLAYYMSVNYICWLDKSIMFHWLHKKRISLQLETQVNGDHHKGGGKISTTKAMEFSCRAMKKGPLAVPGI